MNEQDDPGSSKHSNGVAMPSTSREISDDLYNLSVDEALSRLLVPLRLARLRRNPPDDCELIALHEQLTQVISNEPDGQRRRKLSKANPQINFIREQVLALIRVRLSKNRDSPNDSKNLTAVDISRLIETLDAIVSESFDEEFRKVATLLGVVDVVAELLVLEIDVYKSEIQESQAQHRSVRKLIANALTNLTFGNAVSKRRLCEHEGFVDTLVTILTQQSTLVQVYAGLIRNVSWMADPTMCRLLAPTCRAVAKAFVAAYYRAHAMSTGTTNNHREPKDREMSTASSTNREMSAVSATLSALWNLASHSMENKQSICETSYCLTYLTWILTLDTKSTVLVESASGVLKYSSQYLSASERFHQVRSSLLVSLIRMLHASSFTVVSNTLSAIDSLIGHDAKLQNWLRLNQAAFAQLNILRNSAREDIRALVKRVLNHLNNAAMYTSQQYTPVEMSASMGGDMLHSSRYTDANRLLTLRSSRASPGAQLSNLSPGSLYHRSSSLPRHFQTNHRILGTHAHQMPLLMQTSDRPIYQPSVQSDSHTSQESGVVIGDENVSGDAELMEEISDSLKNSRAPSEQSLTSMLPPGNISSGWESVVDTTENSGRESPVSESELPDSPTMCANLPEFNAFANMSAPLLHSLPPIGALHISTPSSSRQKPSSKTGSRYTTTSASDATSVPSERAASSYPPQPTTQNSQSDDDILPGPIDENEGDYGVLQLDTGLLEKSIETALPPPRRTEISERNPPLLSAAIESALPQRHPPVSLPPRIPNSQGLLDAAILSAMPSASPFSSHQMSTGSKNVQTGDRYSFQQPPRSPVTQKGLNNSWLQQKDDHFDSFSSSINGFESEMGQYNDEENSSATDSSSEIEPVTEVIIDLPSDVLEEVAASIKQENEKKSNIGRNARPIPPVPSTIAAKISKLRPPATTRKPSNGALTKVAATVSPFNHKMDGKTSKPMATTEKEIQNGNRKQMPPSSNQMLVSTV